MRYRAYFPPDYPYEAQARVALDATTEAAAHDNGIVSFHMPDVQGHQPGGRVVSMHAGYHRCPLCDCVWCIWVPLTSATADPGKCPACHPVAAELESGERARLLAEIAAADTVDLTCMLALYPSAIAPLTVACDAAQNSRTVAEYRSPRDIARIAELETALENAGLLV